MEQRENTCQSDEKVACTLPTDECAVLRERLRLAELEIGRLQNCLGLKTQELDRLTRVIVNFSIVHCDVETRLQRELDAARTGVCGNVISNSNAFVNVDSSDSLITVKLPYITSILSVLFDSMFEFWADCDPQRLPKSSAVAHAIDARLGLAAQTNGEASRSGQAYASAIRPDWVKDADRRHHRHGQRH
ncbi:hypothetical protein [Burkholderia sp. MSMB1459WGS]|uniref:hypothetical protein n=1 Tax=Burkholderia sp. MSMB1459WGS TaxID=1637970 RepID=UPI0009EB54EB|nr:hypothetical protein [Burkholderia sp. MSMB1459WGS]